LSVNDRGEIGTLECHPSSKLCGHRLNNPKVVVDSASVVQTFSYLSEGRSNSVEDLRSHGYAHLGVSARNTQYVERMRRNVDLVFISGATLADRSRVASARSSRDRDSLHTHFKKGRGFLSGMNTGVSAAKI
jgi:hypothetical protein